jgi:2-dehydropantoate 2-reductase
LIHSHIIKRKELNMNLYNEYHIKNICIFGVGSVGGVFGGKIAKAISQEIDTDRKVFFIARGEHLEEIKRNGLILNTPEESGIVCKPTLATDNIAEIPQPDLYLLCVKGYDLDDATIAIKTNIGTHTLVIPLLNGVDIYERIRKNMSKGIVFPGCVYIGALLERPGVVTHAGGPGLIAFGKDPHLPDFDPTGIINFFNDMGIQFTWSDDASSAQWQKFVFIAGYGLVTAYTAKTFGEILSDSKLKELVRKVMDEIAAVAKKKGVPLAETIVANSLQLGSNFPPETKTSFQRDVEAKGKRHEGDLFGGTIIRLGKELGVPTPVTESIYANIEG